MIEIQNTLISKDIFKKEFVCNLSKCKGICCVLGDAGAPLEKEEVIILDEIYPKVKPFLREEGVFAIEKLGTSVIDFEGEEVTPLINNKECAYVIFDKNNIAKCGIEKAFEENEIEFQKPISCHLYPIRIKKYKQFEAINYDIWDVCSEACKLGKSLKISVLNFLKTPLIRKYGKKWYNECKEVEKRLP